MLLGKDLYSQDRALIFLRECMQNSLDAGATRIDVSASVEGYTNSGKLTITVSDNGSGISDFESFFLTIGGSTKRETAGSIGGFGIAKLAIIAMDDWNIRSVDGYIERDMLFNGLEKDSSASYEGCSVTGVDNDGWYGWDNRIITYLSLIVAPNCEIYYNGDIIQKARCTKIRFGSEKGNFHLERLEDDCYDSREIWVRLNGLPQYTKSFYVGNDRGVYIHDIQTDKLAYDPEYPLMPNREDMKPGDEHTRLHNVYTAFCNKVQVEADMEKVDQENIRFIGDNIWGGEMDVNLWDEHQPLFLKFKRYVMYIIANYDFGDPSDFKYGMTVQDNVKAMYGKHNSIPGFLINPLTVTSDNGSVLAAAIHETCHVKQESHYDGFARLMSEVTAGIINDITTGKLVL